MEDGNSSRNYDDQKALKKSSISPLPPTARQNVRRGRPPTPLPRPPMPPTTTTTTTTTTMLPVSEHQLLPIANVIRIMRKAVPQHAKISDEAKFTIQESVTELIRFVTQEAHDRCRNEHRRTITGEDILFAMGNLGLDDYVEPLTLYLQKYREFEGLNHPRHQLMGFMPRAAVMVPPIMSPNFSNNANMFVDATQQQQNYFSNYEPVSSSSSCAPPAPAPATYAMPSVPAQSEGFYSILMDSINFDGGSCCTENEVEFGSIQFPAGDDAASTSGSTSASILDDELFDSFAQFK